MFHFDILSLNKVVAAIASLGLLYVNECFLFVWLVIVCFYVSVDTEEYVLSVSLTHTLYLSHTQCDVSSPRG